MNVLNEDERQGYIQKNCSKLVILPKKEDNKDVQILTIQEQEKFLEAIKGHELIIYIVALDTELRIGEILGLKWSDIDF